MNRIDRLMGMMVLLQSRKYVPAEKLADKFSISVRTVYRDIKALNEIGVPVSFEPVKGYFIVQGFFLPPLSFTQEEANALILLQALAGKFTDHSIRQHSETALQKIRSVLRSPDKDRTERLSSQTGIYIAPADPREGKYLSAVQQAIINKTVLKVAYLDNDGKESNREIEPIGLVFYTYQWHLIAWCRWRKDYRDFKVAQLIKLSTSSHSFSREHRFSPEEYMKLF